MNKLDSIKKIREKLKSNKSSIGSWIQIPDTSIAEIMGQAGYDWVAIDMEHGSISVNQLPDLFRALELGSTLPLVRVNQGKEKDCKQALDAGAGGIIVPMVNSAKQLETIKDFSRWPPSGKRGVAFSRANLFGKHFKSYIEEAQKPLIVAMIEDITAITNLDEILQVEDLDSIFIGPYDLSASMGLTAQFENPEFISTIEVIMKKAKNANIPCGIHIVQPSKLELKQKLIDGYQFIAYSIDAVFLNEAVCKPNI